MTDTAVGGRSDARLPLWGLPLLALTLGGCALAGSDPRTDPGGEALGSAPPESASAPESAPAPAAAEPEPATAPEPRAASESAMDGAPGSGDASGRLARRALDRSIREALGDDPIGLVHAGEDSRVFPLEGNERVESWIRYFQSRIGERFQLYLARQTRYETMIRRKLREAEVPQDLIYLSLIESGMSPDAYSRAHAVGLWQFISGTGRRYGLEISYWLDERRDPEKATDAAVAHLKDLYEEFGSWYLAAAAYNGGPNRVRRGLRQVPGGTFWDLADRRLLRRETRDYVPKIIAAAMIGHDPERYGFEYPEKETLPEYETVLVPDATSFDVLAEVAGTDEEMIDLLNPHFPRSVTPPHREVEVRIPVGAAEQFAVRYAAVPVDERVTWTFHTVERGHTLGWIGQQYGVSVAALRAANGNVNPRRLQIGQQLVVPRAGGGSARRTAVASAPSPRPAAPAAGPVTIVVREGDSLWLIARRHSVSTRQIIEWNRLSSSLIHPGDRLEIRR